MNYIFKFICIILLTLTTGVAKSENVKLTSTTDDALILSDDFENNRITWVKTGGASSSTMTVQDGMATLNTTGRYIPANWDASISDYMAECLVKPLSSGGGLTFRGTNIDNTIGFKLVTGEANEASVQIWRRFNKDGGFLEKKTLPFAVSATSYYREVVIVRGSTAECYVGDDNASNDELFYIGSYSLSSPDYLLSGAPGIYTYGTDKAVAFDNFKVYALPEVSDVNISPYIARANTMDANRYQLHTLLAISNVGPLRESRIGISESEDNASAYGEDMWFSLPQYVARMGINAYGRHFRTAGEAAIWDTNYGTDLGINSDYSNPDMAQMFIDDSRQMCTDVVAYYRHEADTETKKSTTEDCIAYDVNGDSVLSDRGTYISLVSPYADRYIERCEELATKGVNTFYFDDKHVNPDGDYSQWSKDKYDEWNGTTNGLVSASNVNLRRHRQMIMSDFFSRLQDSIRTKNPYAETLVSTSEQEIKYLHLYDHAKSEPNLFTAEQKDGFYSLSDALTTVRDASEGRSPHVWISSSYDDMPTVSAARFLAYGAIFNRHADIRILADPDSVPPLWQEQADLTYKINPYISNTKAYNHTLVVADEYVKHGSKSGYNNGVSNKFVRAFYTMKNHGIPVGTILPHQIESDGIPSHVKLLILPDDASAPSALQDKITEFTNAGGTVLYSGQIAGDIKDEIPNTWFENVFGSTMPFPIYTTGGVVTSDFKTRNKGADQSIDNFLDVVSYKQIDSNRRIINLSNGPQDNVVLYISDSIINENTIIYEAVSNTKITAIHTGDYCQINVPSFTSLATLVFDDVRITSATALTVVNNNDGAIKYTGTWQDVTDHHNVGASSGNIKSASITDSNASAEFTFEGTEIQLGMQKRLGSGHVNIYLDDVLVKGYCSTSTNATDYVNDSIYNQYITYRNTNLSAGQHTIKVEAVKSWHPFVESENIYFDYFAYRPLGTVMSNEVTAIESGSYRVENNQLDIYAYPNPTTDYLNIVAQQHLSSFAYEIIDVQGNTILCGTARKISEGELFTINTTSLPQGIYVLRYNALSTDNTHLCKSIRIIKSK